MAHLLIVDDDPNTLASLARAFRLAGHEATVCDNAARALELAKSQPFDMMLSDVVMPGKDGLALLEDLRALGIALPVVMISGQANIEMAVRATRLGALDFLEKPLSTDKLLLTVDNVLKLKRLEDENRDLRQRVGKHEIVYAGRAHAARDGAGGPRGRQRNPRLHPRRNRHRQRADRARPPRAQPAQKRSLRHPELRRRARRADRKRTVRPRKRQLHRRRLPPHRQVRAGATTAPSSSTRSATCRILMQAKLLRVLEERQVERVGGDRTIPVDVRVIVATHRNLDDLVKKGVFREDLYHRIYVFPLLLPPLRERDGEIPALVAHFAAQVCEVNGWKPKVFLPGSHPGVAALLVARQRARTAQCRGAPAAAGGRRGGCGAGASRAAGCRRGNAGSSPVVHSGSLAERTDAFEREQILAELKRNHQRMTDTARALGLERSHLYKKCQALGIDLRAMREGSGTPQTGD